MQSNGRAPQDLDEARRRLLESLAQEVEDRQVLEAMARVPRERFVPEALRPMAYENVPLPIGHGQTISQPLIVAMMTSALEVRPGEKVLEIGTGSGYQSAVLAELGARVVTVERIPELAERARHTLEALGYGDRVKVLLAGPVLGAPEEAPFDGILVTAGAPRIPKSLLRQMALGGRMVIPVGSLVEQDLLKVVREETGYRIHNLGPCRFVPLVGPDPDAWPEESQERQGRA